MVQGQEPFEAHAVALVRALAATCSLLRLYGEDFWADRLDRDRQGVERGERHALDHVLAAFGGMGSLNDLVLHPQNGHAVSPADVEPLNATLMHHVGDIASHARAMQRSLDRR